MRRRAWSCRKNADAFWSARTTPWRRPPWWKMGWAATRTVARTAGATSETGASVVCLSRTNCRKTDRGDHHGGTVICSTTKRPLVMATVPDRTTPCRNGAPWGRLCPLCQRWNEEPLTRRQVSDCGLGLSVLIRQAENWLEAGHACRSWLMAPQQWQQ